LIKYILEEGEKILFLYELLGEFVHADALRDRKAQREVMIDRWKPPPHGWVKINPDASFHAVTGEAKRAQG
jgi:hypothetical protein